MIERLDPHSIDFAVEALKAGKPVAAVLTQAFAALDMAAISPQQKRMVRETMRILNRLSHGHSLQWSLWRLGWAHRNRCAGTCWMEDGSALMATFPMRPHQ